MSMYRHIYYPSHPQWNSGYKLNIWKYMYYRISLPCAYKTHLNISLDLSM